MLTLRELLEDKTFREFFTTPPMMPRMIAPDHNPWRVYLRREQGGSWARREFHTYPQAFKFLKPLLKEVHDATIQSKGIAFPPPHKVVRVVRNGKPLLDDKKKPVLRRIYWKPVLLEGEEMHEWCPYCRRPTVFRFFSRHHAFPRGYEFDTDYRRCTICGISERMLLGGY